MSDTIYFEILEDGTISMKTSEVSATNHMSADELLENISELAGGQVIKKPNPDAKAKAHAHAHKHGLAHNHH